MPDTTSTQERLNAIRSTFGVIPEPNGQRVFKPFDKYDVFFLLQHIDSLERELEEHTRFEPNQTIAN